DLARVALGQRPAKDREVLGEYVDGPAVNASGASDDPIAGDALLVHVEVMALVDDEPIELRERALVEEELEPLARGLLAGLVLAPDSLGSSRQLGREVAAAELVESLLEGHTLLQNSSAIVGCGAGPRRV